MPTDGHPLLCSCNTCKPPHPPWQTSPTGLHKPQKRVKSLAGYIRQKTKSSREVVRFMVDIMRDTDQHTSHRMEAAKWLVDRSEGKAVERSVMLRIEADPGKVRVGGDLTDEALADLINSLRSPTRPEAGGLGQVVAGELSAENATGLEVAEQAGVCASSGEEPDPGT